MELKSHNLSVVPMAETFSGANTLLYQSDMSQAGIYVQAQCQCTPPELMCAISRECTTNNLFYFIFSKLKLLT